MTPPTRPFLGFDTTNAINILFSIWTPKTGVWDPKNRVFGPFWDPYFGGGDILTTDPPKQPFWTCHSLSILPDLIGTIVAEMSRS